MKPKVPGMWQKSFDLIIVPFTDTVPHPSLPLSSPHLSSPRTSVDDAPFSHALPSPPQHPSSESPLCTSPARRRQMWILSALTITIVALVMWFTDHGGTIDTKMTLAEELPELYGRYRSRLTSGYLVRAPRLPCANAPMHTMAPHEP